VNHSLEEKSLKIIMINLNKIGYTKKASRVVNILTINVQSSDYFFFSKLWLITGSFCSIHKANELLVSKKKLAVPLFFGSCLLKIEIYIWIQGKNGGKYIGKSSELITNSYTDELDSYLAFLFLLMDIIYHTSREDISIGT
jgi:hypothetical protein